MERKENCQRQNGMDCRGCEVAVEVARNVLSNPKEPVVESITEVAFVRCPVDTKFLLHGDFRDLLVDDAKVIQLRRKNGQSKTNSEISGAEAAGL